MNYLKYYLRDAIRGILKNKLAAAATILLIAVLCTFIGSSLMIKSSADHLVTFLNSQVKLKVFVEADVDIYSVRDILEKNEYILHVEVEPGENILERMSQVFHEQGQQFSIFKPIDFPDSINIELTKNEHAKTVADFLSSLQGISTVIYPQQYAEKIVYWTQLLTTYGTIFLAVISIIIVLSIASTINLALLQRQSEVRIKMLLGANPHHVRGQFLFEGWLLAFLGSLVSIGVLFIFYDTLLTKLYVNFEFVFAEQDGAFLLVVLPLPFFSSLLGLIGAYLSTRRLIRDA